MRKKLKIGFDVVQTCESRAGCAWYADALIRAMVQEAPQNEYFLYHRFGRKRNTDPEQGTQIKAANVRHPFLKCSRRDATALWQNVAKGKCELPGKPDIVQSNSFQAPDVGNARLVVVIHDISFWAHPEFTTEQNRLRCQQGVCEALGRADGFLFISKSARDEFNRMLPGWLERNRIPNTVVWEASRISVPYVPGNEGGYWLAVGSIEPRKNYETLLNAMTMYYRRSAQPLPLYVAGGKGWRSEKVLSQMAKLAKDGVVREMGYVPEEALPALYRDAFGLLFPSWYEGFGLPVLEALQCGCPVVCSDRTSLPEIGGSAVSYIDPASPESICEAMLRLEEDKNRRSAMIEAGLRRAARFTWAATARATLDFYDQVLTRPKRSSKR